MLSDAWTKLEQVDLDYRRSDGQWQPQRREVYHRGAGAAVLLYNLAQRSIVLTRQFRYPAWCHGGDGFLLEVPAGLVEHGDAMMTICEETEQETGYLIKEARYLFTAFTTPGSVTEQVYYFCAPYDPDKRSGAGGGLAEEGEDIEVMEIKLDQAVRWIEQGLIVDAKSIILIQYAQLHIFGSTTRT